MQQSAADITRTKYTIAACLAAILIGCVIASLTQTVWGRVSIQDLRFAGASGNVVSALLYVPEGVTSENPAPGILAIHGYINSRETQSGFAIEFARRGYVVLAIDETGHGFSSPPAFAAGFGGPDGLIYLRSLPFVDKHRVGLEGHSMGGWAVLMAAAAFPDDYQAMVLEGSSTGTLGTPVGTPEFPRNLGLVYSRYDEFSAFMWGSARAPQIVTTRKLQRLFGTDRAVIPGRMYGEIDKGTARKLMMPGVTHPGDHLSTEAIGDAIEWFQQTLGSESDLSADDQIWFYKELGTLIALLFLAILVFPLSRLLLETAWFSGLKQQAPQFAQDSPLQKYVGLLLLTGIPALTYFKFQEWGNQALPANAIWPQNVTNGIMIWALGNGLITVLLLFARYPGYASLTPLLVGSESNSTLSYLLKSVILALLINLLLYALLALADGWFSVDFRFWVVALKLLSRDQAISFLAYLPFFTLFFIVLSLAMHRQLAWVNKTGATLTLQRSMLYNAGLLVFGILVLLVMQYLPLFMGSTMLFPNQPLLTIVALQFVPLLGFVAATSTWLYSLTGRVYAGAFLNSIFVSWYIVAGQATHFAR